MRDTIDFEKARDRAAFEKMLEKSNYPEQVKPIIRQGFEAGYDQARDRAQQARSGQLPEKIDTSKEGATGAETVRANGRTERIKVVASWVDPNPENSRVASEQKISKGTGLQAAHGKPASSGGPSGKENINLFNGDSNNTSHRVIDNQTQRLAANGEKVFQISLNRYDPHKEGYGLQKPVYEDKDRMVFPAEGEPRHERVAVGNFPNEKSRNAAKALEQREAAAREAATRNPQSNTPSATQKPAATLKVVSPSGTKSGAGGGSPPSGPKVSADREAKSAAPAGAAAATKVSTRTTPARTAGPAAGEGAQRVEAIQQALSQHQPASPSAAVKGAQAPATTTPSAAIAPAPPITAPRGAGPAGGTSFGKS